MTNGSPVTIAQALASQLSNLQVVDTAANIANALPNPGLVARVASFTINGSATLSAAMADQLALLDGKFHLSTYQLTVRDSLAAIESQANAGGLALAAVHQVADAAYNLLNAAPGAFMHVNNVILTGTPILTVAQTSRLESLPGFSVQAGAHVTLADSLAAIGTVLTTHPAWFASVAAVSVRLDGSSVGAYTASQLAGLETHGKTVTFSGSGANTMLQVVAAAHDLAANEAGLNMLAGQVGVTFTVTNPGAAVSAADGAALAGLHGFSPAHAALVVSDTGANITAHEAALFGHGFTQIVVASGNLAGTAAQLLDPTLHVDAGATVSLAANATIGAAQCAVLGALPGFALGNGVTIAVVDNAADLIANAAGLTDAASILMNANATVSAAGATLLALLQEARPDNFSLGGHSLTIDDTASALLALPGPVLALASGTTLSQSTVTGATTIAALATLPEFHLASGVTLTASDSAANLLSYAGSLGIASSVVVNAPGTLTAAGATALAQIAAAHPDAFSLDGNLMTVTDTAPALLGLGGGALALAGALDLSANGAVNAAQFMTLRDTLHVAGNGYSLSVDDTAANLLGLSGSLALVGATVLTAGATVNAAQAAALAGEPAFSTGGFALVISDNAANLLALGGPLQAIATSLALSGAIVVRAAQLTALAGLGIKFSEAGFALSVTDTASNLAGLSVPALALVSADGGAVVLTQSATVSGAAAASLVALPNFGLANGVSLTVQDSAANLLALPQGVLALAGTEELPAGAVTLSVAQGAGLAALPHFSTTSSIITVAGTVAALNNNATLGWHAIAAFTDVVDTGANLAAAASSQLLQTAALVGLSGNSVVNAAQAVQLATIPTFTSVGAQLTVVDGAVAVAGAEAAIASLGALAEVNDSGPVTAAQADALAALAADPGGLVFIGGSSLTVADSYAALISGANATGVALAARLSVVDTPANLILASQHGWGALNPSYVLSANSTVAGAQASALAAIGAFFSLGGHTLQMVDNAANVLANSAALGTLGISAVVMDTGAHVVSDAGALAGLGAALSAVDITDAASLSAASGAALAPLAAKLASSVVVVGDNAANVFGNVAGLDAVGGAIGAHLVLTITDSAAAIGAHAAAFAGVGGQVFVVLTNGGAVTATVAAALAPLAGDFGFSPALAVTDTGAALAGNESALAALGGAIGTVTLSDGTTQTAAVAATLAGIDAHFSLGVKLTATGGAAQIAAASVGLERLQSDGRLQAVIDNADTAAGVAAHAILLNQLGAAVTISDSAANVASVIDTLAAVHGLSSITLTDGGTPALTVNVYSTEQDGAVLAAIVSDYTLQVTDTAAAIAADLGSGSSGILAHLGLLSGLTSLSGALSLTQTVALREGVDDGAGSALSFYSGTLDVTQVSVANLASVAGLGNAPSTIEMSDTAAHIQADLTGGSSFILANLEQVTSIAVSDAGTVSLTVAQLLGAGVDDGAESACAKLVGGTLAVTGATVAQLGSVTDAYVEPARIGVSDTAAHIQADLASGNSQLVADLSHLSQIVVSDAGVITLTEAQVLAAGVDSGPNSVLGLESGGTLVVTNVAADDVGRVLALAVAPSSISVNDSAVNIAANLSGLVAALGSISAITVNSGTLSLTAVQAESAGVASGPGSVVGDISGHLYNVSNALISQIAALTSLTDAPHLIAISDSSVDIAADLAAGNSAILANLAGISGITVTGGVLSLTATTALAISSNINAVAALLAPGTMLDITGVALSQLASIANIVDANLHIAVTDSAAHVADDLLSGSSLLAQDSALLSSVTLSSGGTLTAAELTALAGYAPVNLNGQTLNVSDSAAAIAGLGVGARALANTVSVVDNAADVTAQLGALQTVYGGHLSITLTDQTPVVSVSAATYTADRPTLDAITNAASVTVTGTVAGLTAITAALTGDAAVAHAAVTDSSTNVISNLNAVLALGSKLTVTLNDNAPLLADVVIPLLQITNLNTGGRGVADNGSQIAAVVETGNAGAIAFLNNFGATLAGNSSVAVADVAALASLTDFSKGGHTLVVWDTAAHLTGNGAAAALSSPLINGVYLQAPGDAVTVTAAQAAGLFAIANFSPNNPDSSANVITVSDSAAHIDAVHAALGTIGAAIAQIVVNSSATITDAVLGDLQTLHAVDGNGVTLTVRDSGANIAAGAVTQASGQSVEPVAWQLAGSSTISEANAVVLGNLVNFSAGPYVLTLNLGANTVISVADANAVANIAGSLNLNGFQLEVSGTVAQLSGLSAGALALVRPELVDSFININALSASSPLLAGTVTVSDAESVTVAQAEHFLSLLNGGSGPGITPANLSFGGHTETITDSISALQGLTSNAAWTGNAGQQGHFALTAADSVANLINAANTGYLAGLHATTLAANVTTTAAQAESLATLANQIHFGLGDHTLTIADTAAALLTPSNSDGEALATTLTLAGPDSVNAAQAETLLGLAHFVLGTPLVISDNSENLLDGVLSGVVSGSPYESHITVELAAPETLDAQTAEALVSLPAFNATQDISIADSSAYLLNSAYLSAEQMAVSVTLAGDETVSANTVLRLSEVPNFTAGESTLTLASNDFADAATLKAVADLGVNFSDGGHSLTVTQDALALTPAEYGALQSDGVLANGHLISAVPVNTQVTDTANLLSLTATGVSGATVNVYDGSGNILSSTVEQQAGFTVHATDNTGAAFSVTEVVNGVESAPLVVLDATMLENAVSGLQASFAASGTIEVANGQYLNLYTAGNVPMLQAPALVYDPTAHTVSLDVPGHTAITLITLGSSTAPGSLLSSEILVKSHSGVA